MIAIIVAMDDKCIIGNKGSIPWNLPEETQHFKETTWNGTLIVGRKTYESLKNPLENREIIVLTKNESAKNAREEKAEKKVKNKNTRTAKNMQQAITIAKENKASKDIFIAGGTRVYQEGMQYADTMLISRIPGVHEGDTFFPEWDKEEWQLSETKQYKTFTRETYKRKRKGTEKKQKTAQ